MKDYNTVEHALKACPKMLAFGVSCSGPLHGIWVSFLSKDASMILETTEEVFSFLLDPKPHTLDPIYYVCMTGPRNRFSTQTRSISSSS